MKKIAFGGGIVAMLLGGLWLLQGLGVVQMQPLLCFANCEPVQGASVTWVVIGAAVLAAGGSALFWTLKPRAK